MKMGNPLLTPGLVFVPFSREISPVFEIGLWASKMAAQAANSSSDDEDFLGFTGDCLSESGINNYPVDSESDISLPSDSSDSETESDIDDDASNFVPNWKRENLFDVQVIGFSEASGPKHRLPDTSNRLNFFYLMWDYKLFDIISDETNRYAQQRGASDHWYDTTPDEIRAYFSISVMMGIKSLPQVWCYWRSDQKLTCRCEFIAKIMSKNRYLLLTKYIHLRDNTGAPE